MMIIFRNTLYLMLLAWPIESWGSGAEKNTSDRCYSQLSEVLGCFMQHKEGTLNHSLVSQIKHEN
ncbi:MAG: hypothetical protein K2X39_07895, partial [Silvanigrellaceae bacterium]|nr:hypothetical protein [Silvanigrellaceae bacterium]